MKNLIALAIPFSLLYPPCAETLTEFVAPFASLISCFEWLYRLQSKIFLFLVSYLLLRVSWLTASYIILTFHRSFWVCLNWQIWLPLSQNLYISWRFNTMAFMCLVLHSWLFVESFTIFITHNVISLVFLEE